MPFTGGCVVLICTYNVRNLFLDDEGPVKPHHEVRPLRRMLEQINADVVMLQEVGSSTSLERLNEGLAQPYPVCELLPGNSNRSIHLGLLARYPFALTSHRDVVLADEAGRSLQFYASETDALAQRAQPLRLQRDLLLVEGGVGDSQSLALFGVHLKSRTNQAWQMLGADEIRAAECRAVAEIISAYRVSHPSALIGLLGDFNDLLSSDALSAVRKLGLFDPLGAALRSSGRNPSTYWPKRRMRIDHILLSENAVRYVASESPTIHANHMARTASDHYPVTLKLMIPTRNQLGGDYGT